MVTFHKYKLTCTVLRIKLMFCSGWIHTSSWLQKGWHKFIKDHDLALNSFWLKNSTSVIVINWIKTMESYCNMDSNNGNPFSVISINLFATTEISHKIPSPQIPVIILQSPSGNPHFNSYYCQGNSLDTQGSLIMYNCQWLCSFQSELECLLWIKRQLAPLQGRLERLWMEFTEGTLLSK